jgi:hypothetical protein
MKERNAFSCFRVYARQIRALVRVAAVASQRQVVGPVSAAVLSGNNVLDVERCMGHGRLRKMAVFASPTGTAAYQVSQGAVHQALERLVRTARARA